MQSRGKPVTWPYAWMRLSLFSFMAGSAVGTGTERTRLLRAEVLQGHRTSFEPRSRHSANH
jgi:hypothetical protein